MAPPADNEHKRRAAVRFFAVARPPVATRMQWVEEDAAGFVRLLEGGQKIDTADMRRWAKRAQSVCHTVFAEPAPPSLDRLIELLMNVKDQSRSRIKNREKYNAAVRFRAKHREATVSRIKRAIGYDQRRTIKRWLADPKFQDAVEQQRLEDKIVQGG
jgi:hypothetical protein